MESPAEEPELAVFRFTLGIPGFDDSLIPRIIGASSLLLLLANSVLSSSPYSTSQVSLCTLRITLKFFPIVYKIPRPVAGTCRLTRHLSGWMLHSGADH